MQAVLTGVTRQPKARIMDASCSPGLLEKSLESAAQGRIPWHPTSVLACAAPASSAYRLRAAQLGQSRYPRVRECRHAISWVSSRYCARGAAAPSAKPSVCCRVRWLGGCLGRADPCGRTRGCPGWQVHMDVARLHACVSV